MNGPTTFSAFDTAPDITLKVVSAFVGPVLVDLDETLYLRNSTEDFLDCARPALVVVLVLRALDLIRPWRWTGGAQTRDVWRVRLVCAMFPWTRKVWAERVESLARRFGNQPLIEVLRGREAPPIIATVGFEPVVKPLLRAIDIPGARLVAARSSTFEDRRAGKLSLVIENCGEDTVRRALVITDSLQDLPLLEACAEPLRTVWPEARYQMALARVYLPGQYLTLIKRPGERYILRGILQEDFAFWALCSLALASSPLTHLAGLSLLLLSFWAIYEQGYVDNDQIAARFEDDPKLSRAFHEQPVATPRLTPWIWAAGSGAAAVFLLRWPGPAAWSDYALWALVLTATFGWFRLYNRLDKSSRVWAYPGLQMARSAAFLALVPMAPIGAAALGAHVVSRWIPYYLYRLSRQDWPQAPTFLVRLMLFVVLASFMAATQGVSILMNASAAALMAWNLYRARQELATLLRSMRRIDRGPKPPPASP